MKLIRDKYALTHDPFGRTVFIAPVELQKRLILDKVAEEAFEIIKAKNVVELIEEVADLEEVIERLKALHGIASQVSMIRADKAGRKGVFDQGYALV